MQGVLKALGKVSYCLRPQKMLDDCVIDTDTYICTVVILKSANTRI